MNQSRKGISIIICTYNGAARLPETLRCIANQENTNDFPVEVIVIDNASKDGTAEIARNIWQDLGNRFDMKVLHEPKQGKSNALVTGFAAAEYDYLLICDDDNRLFPDYLAKAYETMEAHPEIGVLGGQGIPDFESAPPSWIMAFQLAYGYGPQNGMNAIRLTEIDHVYGAGSVLRKCGWTILTKIGFNSLLPGRVGYKLLSGEDVEMSLAYKLIDYKIAWNPEMRFHHLITNNRITWDYLKNLHICFGRAKNYINIYREIELGKENPQNNLKLPFWFDRSIHVIKDIIRFKTRHHLWFIKQKKNIGNTYYLRLQGLKGELFELISMRSKITDKYNQVIKLRERIKKL